MTREEVKKKIGVQIERATDNYWSQTISNDCLEEIMKLWDQGFAYEVKNERT